MFPTLITCAGVDCTFVDFIETLNRIVHALAYAGIVIALFLIARAGFVYMGAGGSQVVIAKAKSILWHAILMLLLVGLAFPLVDFIFDRLVKDEFRTIGI